MNVTVPNSRFEAGQRLALKASGQFVDVLSVDWTLRRCAQGTLLLEGPKYRVHVLAETVEPVAGLLVPIGERHVLEDDLEVVEVPERWR